MKRLLFVIITAALAWSGYWFVGSRGATAGFERWFADRQAEGWVAETSGIVTRGFPSRFDTTISDLELADPQTGVAYSTPFLQIFALSYKPEHLIAVWPNAQSLATPFGKLAIASEDMRASLIVDGAQNVALERSNFAAKALQITAEDGRKIAATSLLLAAEAVPAAQNTYHVGIEATGLSLPQPQSLRLETGDLLPDTFERARADVTIAFDAPWDLNAVQAARPQPTQIDIKLIEAQWGQLDLRLAGSLDIDAAGVPSGQITVKAQNWRDILKLAVATGALPQQLARPMEQGLSLLSGLSGNRNTLDVPLDFANGRVLLGPIPIGPAPRIVLR